MKIRKPQVSVRMCRLRPLTFLPASKPDTPPLSVVFTDWLSITPALGEASRPSISRRFMTSTVLMAANRPALRQA